MIRSKKIDALCMGAIALAMLITVGLMVGCFLFVDPEAEQEQQTGYISDDYVGRIFDDTYVHEIDIRLPQVNWDYMVDHAEEEQYVICTAVVDGETWENVAIRPKGNSSLKAIKTQGSDRFSFKLEFDHYRPENTYYGLDKLALNNLGQDVSCMKDFLTYHMMNEAGIAAPLSSYVQLKLNGEDFGLYLAVEAVEDSFAYRNYGAQYGNIYKPECFAIENVTLKAFINTEENIFEKDFESLGPGERADIMGTFIRTPFEKCFGENMEAAALKYVGEDLGRYQVFFDASVFEITQQEKQSLVDAIRRLNSVDDPQDAVELDSVIRYFLVHNFVNNYDGYTGIFVHNYYLRECNGKLSMIPWDYNLSFGIFTVESAIKSIMGEDSPYQVELKVGQAMDDGTGMVNFPIDTPTFTVSTRDRPLLALILDNEAYLEQYHREYQEFLDRFFGEGKFEKLYRMTWDNIAPYVERGQTFYTAEQFQKATETVYDYCLLREESIRGQLNGTIPATMEGQKDDYRNLVDASSLNLASSVTFDSLVFGIRSEDVVGILDAIAGDHPHNSAGVAEAFSEAGQSPGAIGAIIGRVLVSSKLLQKAIASVISGPILLIIAIIVLSKAVKRVKKYRRRRPPA